MNILPLEIQSLIINLVKCSCLDVCKTWVKILKDNSPNNDLITHIVNKDYYAIQFNCFHFPGKLKDKEIINVAIIMNDSLVFKIMVKTIYQKILPDSESILMYFIIDNENRVIIDSIVKYIIGQGNYKALEYFIEIHNDSGFPDNLTYMTNISNIIDIIKHLDVYNFGHFMMIDYLMKDTSIEWCDDDFEFIIKMLSSSFDKFHSQLKNSFNRNQNTIKSAVLIDKLINKNKQKIKTRKNINFIKERNVIYDKKAYLECIRHGLYNIIQGIPLIEVNNILIDNNEFTFFLLTLSGNCDLKDIIEFYNKGHNKGYYIDYNEDLIKDFVNKLDIEERYNELMKLII